MTNYIPHGLALLIAALLVSIIYLRSRRRNGLTCKRCHHYPIERAHSSVPNDTIWKPQCPNCGWSEGMDPSIEGMLGHLFPSGSRLPEGIDPEVAIRVLAGYGEHPADLLNKLEQLLKGRGTATALAKLLLWRRPFDPEGDLEDYTCHGMTWSFLQEVDLAAMSSDVYWWDRCGPLIAEEMARLWVDEVSLVSDILMFYSVHVPCGEEAVVVTEKLGLVHEERGYRLLGPEDAVVSMESG